MSAPAPTTWRRHGHLLVSPALSALGFVAGSTTRGLVATLGPSVNAEQLRAEGVGTIEIAGACTKCGDEEVFSQRGGDIGLLGLAFIGAYAGGEPPAIPPQRLDPPGSPGSSADVP